MVDIIANKNLLPGYMALKRRGMVVWVGPIGASLEGVGYDTMVVSKADYQMIELRIKTYGEALQFRARL